MPDRINQISGNTLNLFRIDTRGIGFTKDLRTPYSFHVALASANEREAVALAKQRYGDKWWEENIITDVVLTGKLLAIEKVFLYDAD